MNHQLRVEADVHSGRWLVFQNQDMVAMAFDETIARLIARAPDLAAQNEALLGILKDALCSVEFEGSPYRPWHSRARAAIAAVEGEQE